MLYSSTRGKDKNVKFDTVLINGLAKDGGLYVPNKFKYFDQKKILSFKDLKYYELAYTITYDFVKDSISSQDYLKICKKTYEGFSEDKILSHTKLDDNELILNLFHGPTLAFKDFALQLLGNIYDFFLKKMKTQLTIIGATSGDTGSAAIEGCSKSELIKIFILFPHEKVSEIQRRQMTTFKKTNVFNIAIRGDFDDCQNLVKSLFERNNKKKIFNFAAVNSINWVRIMGQIVYYFWSYLNNYGYKKNVNFVVPTGNFGNIYAGYVAKKMGLPINKLVVASNANDVLPRFYKTGLMSKKKTIKTLSPSMDIQISSNFERLLFDFSENMNIKELFNNLKKNGSFFVNDKKLDEIKNFFYFGSVSDTDTINTIKQIYNDYKIVIDPHTAVGISLGRSILGSENLNTYLATAHYGKFIDTINESLNRKVDLPKRLKSLIQKEEKFKVIENNLDLIENYISENT